MKNDPIADMLTRIKNAGAVRKSSVVIPFSKMKFATAELLAEEGFVKSVTEKGKNTNKFIEIELIYEDGETPKIVGSRRVSKQSRRVYGSAKDLRPVKSGRGTTVLSTPQGILSDKEAKKNNVGGEILFEIW